jgi:hypothetical protein
MSRSENCGSNGFIDPGLGSQCTSFLRHLREFIGETVTIFTTSGGASGCGFTGVILSVNSCFVRLVTEQGTAPSNPLAENICPDINNGGDGRGLCGLGGMGNLGKGNGNYNTRAVGSVVDIPIDRIAAFTHNAI